MSRVVMLFAFIALSQFASAQKVESIAFNLYTDSLKKGFYNYISVDGKCSDGQWLPLDSTHIILTANTGHFQGNDLYIDSAYQGDSVVVKATLKKNPAISRQITIYIRKRGFDEPLKTDEEILNELRQRPRKKAQWRNA